MDLQAHIGSDMLGSGGGDGVESGWREAIGDPVDCARCPVDCVVPCSMSPDRAIRALSQGPHCDISDCLGFTDL